MDSALDDLIDTLGEPEETEEDNVAYTGPEVLVCDLDTCKGSFFLGRREKQGHDAQKCTWCCVAWREINCDVHINNRNN